jgi:cytochrome c2
VKQTLSIAAFTVVVSFLYTGVGQLVPQLENRPPPEVKAGTNISPDTLAEAGAGVFEANCVQCHKLGESGRGPDLASLGGIARGRAAERSAGGKPYTDVEYIVESLCKPGDYLVKGFGNIMPPQGKALSGGQILAVTAFLQNLGGTASVKGTDTAVLDRFGCVQAAEGGGAAPAVAAKPVGAPQDSFAEFGCATCHSIADPSRKLGPSLQGVGKRLGKGGIYEKLLNPNASVSVGDPPYEKGLMKKTLDGNGFYDRMKPSDYQGLVDWLAKQ